jgi:diguanylate cyclase (GGDEF)-like protein
MFAARNADLSRKDWLTGLLNRRGFFDVLRADGAPAGDVAAGDTSVLAIDIDHFKRINDRWGHAAGDSVLRHFGGLLSAMHRNDRLIARMGGEEFVIVLFGTSHAEACEIAERLRLQVEQSSVAAEGAESVHLTISIGVYTLAPDILGCVAGNSDGCLHTRAGPAAQRPR